MKPIAPVVLAVLTLSACAAVRPAESPKVMRVSPVFPTARTLAAGKLSIAPVQANGVASERRYAYVDAAAPSEVRQAATLFWDDPPPHMLEAALLSGLRARFASVTGPDVPAVGERRIIARLERFEEVTSVGGSASASIALEVTVLAGDNRDVVLAGRYCATSPISAAAPSARADAFNAALIDLVQALGDDLASGRPRSEGC
jgi:ABC-type uncharacterized transport system auxiliary subunit